MKSKRIDKINKILGIEEQKIQLKRSAMIDDFPTFTEDVINIEFELNTSGNVNVLIFDRIANLVKNIECSECQSGKYSVSWDYKNNMDKRVNSGLYYFEVRYNNLIQSRKMIFI